MLSSPAGCNRAGVSSHLDVAATEEPNHALARAKRYDSIGSEPAHERSLEGWRCLAGSLPIEAFERSRWRLRRARVPAMGFELSAFASTAANGARLRKAERKVLHTFALEATESMCLGPRVRLTHDRHSVAREYPTRSVRRASGFVQTEQIEMDSGDTPVREHTRRPTGRRPLLAHLPRQRVEIDVPDTDKQRPCGQRRFEC
jgi:hypothetical protein